MLQRHTQLHPIRHEPCSAPNGKQVCKRSGIRHQCPAALNFVNNRYSDLCPLIRGSEKLCKILYFILKPYFECHFMWGRLPLGPSGNGQAELQRMIRFYLKNLFNALVRKLYLDFLRSRKLHFITEEPQCFNGSATPVPINKLELSSSIGHRSDRLLQGRFCVAKHKSCLLTLLRQLAEYKVGRHGSCGKTHPSGSGRQPILQRASVRFADVILELCTWAVDKDSQQHKACQHQKRQHGDVEPTVIFHSLALANENLFFAGNSLSREAA